MLDVKCMEQLAWNSFLNACYRSYCDFFPWYILHKKSSTKINTENPQHFFFFFFLFYLDVAIENIDFIIIIFHLADAFIQSDFQMRTIETIGCSIKTTKTKTKSLNFKNTTYTHFKNKEIK